MKIKKLALILCAATITAACSGENKTKADDTPAVPEFPYQSYLDIQEEDEAFPTIGDDGSGFAAISDNIRYLRLPKQLEANPLADSLQQLYNIVLAYNSIAYDVSTAERYMDDDNVMTEQADALDAMDFSAITDPRMRDALKEISRKAAAMIREGKRPNDQNDPAVEHFYKTYSSIFTPLLDAHTPDDWYDPASDLPGYADIHAKAVTDSTTYRGELLERTLAEKDFRKKAVLAHEFAMANFANPDRDDMEMVAVVDTVLKEGKYSPMLTDLWMMWRTALQGGIFGSISNDGAMYNLFYNDMRNRVAITCIEYLCAHPDDKAAFGEFFTLLFSDNIVRNSGSLYGNNSILDEMNIYSDVWNKD